MATEKKQYVYRLMKAKCSCGDQKFEQYLNLTKDHGVTYHDNEYPLMNANDHIAGENILTFGRCTSLNIKSPRGIIPFLLESVAIPIVGGALIREKIGCKCEPMTITPWINVDEDYFIDGAPALTIESTLPCYYGGVITIVLQKEDDSQEQNDEENQEETEEKDVKEQLPSEVQEKIDSFTDKEATNPQSKADDVLAEEAAQKEFDISKISRADELLEQEVTIDTSFLDNMKIKPQKETQLDNVPILENSLLKQQEGKGQ